MIAEFTVELLAVLLNPPEVFAGLSLAWGAPMVWGVEGLVVHPRPHMPRRRLRDFQIRHMTGIVARLGKVKAKVQPQLADRQLLRGDGPTPLSRIAIIPNVVNGGVYQILEPSMIHGPHEVQRVASGCR
jgi:hypothetical protein